MGPKGPSGQDAETLTDMRLLGLEPTLLAPVALSGRPASLGNRAAALRT